MKKLSLLILVMVAVASVLGSSCSQSKATVEEKQLTPADELRARLLAFQDSGLTLFGHHDDPVYGHAWCGDSSRSDVLEVAGSYPAMMSWDLGGIELGRDVNLDSVPFDRIRAEVVAQHRRGGINTFSWHLFSPVDSTGSWNIGDSLTVTRIVADSVVNNSFRRYVASLAHYFNGLKDEDGTKVPVIFRPFHEHTGSWFWWGKPYATPEQYKALWQIIDEEFDRAGVDNVLLAYSTDRVATAEQYLEYYPGDDMVDILGADVYHFNGDDGIEDYRATAGTVLAVISDLAARKGKIMAFTETGQESLTVADWWTEVLLPLLRESRPAYVVVWRNAHNIPSHFYVPFEGHPSVDNFRTFVNDSSIVLIKDLK